MINLRDVMSPELYQHLRMYRRGALSTFQGLRDGVVTNQDAAKALISIYHSFEWKIDSCGYGVAHPCYIFAARTLQAAKLLMGEEWVSRRLQH